MVPRSSLSAYRLVFLLFWRLSPVALATAPTAPVTALTAFPLTVLAVFASPDEPRLFEPRFFELELRFPLADFERFLAEDFEPLDAAPPAFLALRAGISPPQGAGERDEIADPAGNPTSCRSAEFPFGLDFSEPHPARTGGRPSNAGCLPRS